METKNIILKLRMQKGLSQDELAEKIMVTRQAGIPLGEWRDSTKYRNIKTFVKGI